MYTGSPYITNFSSRLYRNAEITQTTYGICPVMISFVYDETQHNNLKLVCEPADLFGSVTNYASQYASEKGRWYLQNTIYKWF